MRACKHCCRAIAIATDTARTQVGDADAAQPFQLEFTQFDVYPTLQALLRLLGLANIVVRVNFKLESAGPSAAGRGARSFAYDFIGSGHTA